MSSNFKNYLNTFRFDTLLPGSGEKVTFTPLTTGQIKKILLYQTSDEEADVEEALDEMINECVVEPENFEIKDLYIQDRFYLLVELRKATRGATYNFQSICTSCGSQSNQSLNLSDLPVTRLQIPSTNESIVTKTQVQIEQVKKRLPRKGKITEITSQTEKIEEKPIVKRLDHSLTWDMVRLNDNIVVRLSLVTRSVQQEVFNIFKLIHGEEVVSDTQKSIEMADLLYAMSIKSIISPDGEETDVSLEDKLYFLNNIQQDELEKISNWYEEHDFGIDFSFDCKCVHCGYSERKGISVSNFFY
jgi:hypothetical protein